MTRLLEWLPRGNTLDDAAWHRRHRLLQVVLAIHIPVLIGLGLGLRNPAGLVLAAAVAPVLLLLVAGHYVPRKRVAASFVSAGLVWCSISLVALTGGTIEAHFHFFIIIGFIALYQDWVPFLWNVVFTGVSHVVGTIFWPTLVFNHPAAQHNPWLWSAIHAFAVLLACVGMVIFWRITEDEQSEKHELGRELVRADAEIGRKQFTSDMLVNLARRNQSMLYRQLDIINQLEEKEQDPDQLAELFKLDHLATRVRRNAESLLVLSGEQPPRVWSAPVSLRDVVRAAIAETEDLDRVEFSVDDRVAVSGQSVADLTHLLAELTENAVRFSPPDTSVTIRSRPHRADIGGQVLTVEDWGVGMPADELAAANELLIHPRDVDLSVSQRLGFHVVARLASRHGIEVSLSTTPGSGLTAVLILPAEMFVSDPQAGPHAGIGSGPEQTRRVVAVHEMAPDDHRDRGPAPGIPATVAPAWTPPPAPPVRPLPAPAARTTGSQAAVGEPRPAPRPTPEIPELPPVPSAPLGTGNWSGWWNPSHAGGNGHDRNGYSGYSGYSGYNGYNGSTGNGHDRNGSNGNGHDRNGYRGPNGNGHPGPAATGHSGPETDVHTGHQSTARTVHTGPNGESHRDGRAAPEASDPRPDADREALPRNGFAALEHAAAERADDERSPIPAPRPAPADSAGTGASGLRRRVPQASLAPELRAPAAPAAPATPAAPTSPSRDAAHALSRYQASRQAAQAVAEKRDPQHHTLSDDLGDLAGDDRRTTP
jgi:signal transduction histidine kinase